MELQTMGGRVGLIETVFDDLDERPIDCDFMLPDYLPDITAILKCRMKPVVQSHQISGDRVMADGTVYLHLLYLDEERRCVRSYEHSQPFTATFTVKELKSSDTVRLNARVNYVNCRATGPRRVDVHGAFSVRLVVTSERSAEVLGAAEGKGLYTRLHTVTCSVPMGHTEKTVSINEVLELGNVAVQSLVRSEAAAVITECRQMPGKAIVKGDLLLEAMCQTDAESGAMHRHTERIPFSQILDAEGLTEELVCDCRVRVTQCDMRLVQDPAGENRLLSVAAKLTVSLCCYETEVCQILTDAYHTAYPLKTESCRVKAATIAFVRSDTATLTLTQELPDDGIAEIVDFWCESLPAVCRAEAGQTAMSGQIQVGLIARDADGMLAYYERPMDYETLLPDACDDMSADIIPLETVCVQSGNRLELRLQMAVHRVGTHTEEHTAITAMTVDRAAPYTEEGALAGCCLKVCFAEAGESVWNLARREHTSPEALKAENGLCGDVLEADTMLLIPMR